MSRVLVVSTPMGVLGSGGGGGVELTATAIVAGLLGRGHGVTVLAGEGSGLPASCSGARLETQPGVDQPSWQHLDAAAPITIPLNARLPRFWQWALAQQDQFDVILNLGYDWLPFWLTPHFATPLCHLVSMGSVATVMDGAIAAVGQLHPERLAFHTRSQAAEFPLAGAPIVLGNGLDLSRYHFRPEAEAVLGWAGRIAPEKGLEDGAQVAARLGWPLRVWGLRQDEAYAAAVAAAVPAGVIDWRGFLPTEDLQRELGACQVFLNTPKWNEAFGNVVVEAMACGVPVATYARGGPGELVIEATNGALAEPDNLNALTAAVGRAAGVERAGCRRWVEMHHGQAAFAERLEAWLLQVLTA